MTRMPCPAWRGNTRAAFWALPGRRRGRARNSCAWMTSAPSDACGWRDVKTMLLDHTVIAGIGNLYADESLFRAGIHPAAPADRLSAEQKRKLFDALQYVLRLSIRECGSSIRNYRDAEGNAGAFQNSFAVYGRAGEKCVRCGSVLKKITIGGRTSTFCEKCQKKPDKLLICRQI